MTARRAAAWIVVAAYAPLALACLLTAAALAVPIALLCGVVWVFVDGLPGLIWWAWKEIGWDAKRTP